MKRFSVHFEVDLPGDTKAEEAREWLRYKLGETGSLSGTNPLGDRDLEARAYSVSVREHV